MDSLQQLFDIAVVIPTVLRPHLKRAVNSIFEQDYKGRIQILIGIDKKLGDEKIIEELQQTTPDHIAITVLDLGYSTALRNGGLYTSMAGGSLRTVLSYAANSKYVAYLDDDNWFAPYHLSDLLKAIEGNAWAFSLRWFVDMNTHEIICEDNFFSAGPGKGMYANSLGGLVDTSCYLLDKMKCHMLLSQWCISPYRDKSCEDMQVFSTLMKNKLPFGATGRPSVYYVLETSKYPEATEWLRNKGYNIT